MTASRYDTARYRVAFLYGLRPLDGWPDAGAVTAFEECLTSLLKNIEPIELAQKAVLHFANSHVDTLRKQKRLKGRDLTAYIAATCDANQAGLYVFDALSATEAPSFFANLHLTRDSRFGAVRPPLEMEDEVGRFVAIAVERARITDPLLGDFDRAMTALYDRLRGVVGGVFEDRPYVWNGMAGLEWMYREMAQSFPGGDLASWKHTVDILLG